MGMFDYVNYSAPCPECGYTLTSRHWQTKDADCSMETVQPEDVRQFYCICPKCKAWIDAKVTPARGATVNLYTRKV